MIAASLIRKAAKRTTSIDVGLAGFCVSLAYVQSEDRTWLGGSEEKPGFGAFRSV
jgi:hypothetical protein